MNPESTTPDQQLPRMSTGHVVAFGLIGLILIGGSFALGATSQASLARSGDTSLFAAAAAAITGSASTTATAVVAVAANNPAASTIQASKSSVTSDVTLLNFTVAPKGADEYVNAVTIEVSLSPTTTVPAAIKALKLYRGSTVIGTAHLSSTTPTMMVFDGLSNVVLKDGSTETFRVAADVNPVDGNSLVEGTKLRALVHTGSVKMTTATLGCGTANVAVSGSVVGNYMTLKTAGLVADPSPVISTVVASTTAASSTPKTIGTFTIRFNVTAFGQDLYIPNTPSKAITPTTLVDQNGNATTTQAVALTSTADRVGSTYVIHDGQSKQITVVFSKEGQGGYVKALLKTIKYMTSASSTSSTSYTLPATYVSNAVYLPR